jgi:hypothetical protein
LTGLAVHFPAEELPAHDDPKIEYVPAIDEPSFDTTPVRLTV